MPPEVITQCYVCRDLQETDFPGTVPITRHTYDLTCALLQSTYAGHQIHECEDRKFPGNETHYLINGCVVIHDTIDSKQDFSLNSETWTGLEKMAITLHLPKPKRE